MKKLKIKDWLKIALPAIVIIWGLGLFIKNTLFFLSAKTQIVEIKNAELVMGKARFSGSYWNLVLGDENGTIVKAFSKSYSVGDKIKAYYGVVNPKEVKVYYLGYFTDPWLFVLFGVVFFVGVWKRIQAARAVK